MGIGLQSGSELEFVNLNKPIICLVDSDPVPLFLTLGFAVCMHFATKCLSHYVNVFSAVKITWFDVMALIIVQ